MVIKNKLEVVPKETQGHFGILLPMFLFSLGSQSNENECPQKNLSRPKKLRLTLNHGFIFNFFSGGYRMLTLFFPKVGSSGHAFPQFLYSLSRIIVPRQHQHCFGYVSGILLILNIQSLLPLLEQKTLLDIDSRIFVFSMEFWGNSFPIFCNLPVAVQILISNAVTEGLTSTVSNIEDTEITSSA